MPKVTVLPHTELCPDGKIIEDAQPGKTLLSILLGEDIEVEHACEMSCACTTCHVIVRQGLESLPPATDDEEDMLDKAWGLSAQSRLSCQAKLQAIDVIIEIPRYTINHAREK